MSWSTKDLSEVYRHRGQDPLLAVREGDAPKRSKMGNRKKELDGHLFDSGKEAQRYLELKVQLQAGLISRLTLQPIFLLQEGFRTTDKRYKRPIHYKADFEYLVQEGGRLVHVVEDVKGFKTKDYRMKAKMFQMKYPDIKFVEIT